MSVIKTVSCTNNTHAHTHTHTYMFLILSDNYRLSLPAVTRGDNRPSDTL